MIMPVQRVLGFNWEIANRVIIQTFFSGLSFCLLGYPFLWLALGQDMKRDCENAGIYGSLAHMLNNPIELIC
jgi:hypothetical protein